MPPIFAPALNITLSIFNKKTGFKASINSPCRNFQIRFGVVQPDFTTRSVPLQKCDEALKPVLIGIG
jgi:hypothetical protein